MRPTELKCDSGAQKNLQIGASKITSDVTLFLQINKFKPLSARLVVDKGPLVRDSGAPLFTIHYAIRPLNRIVT